MTKDEFKQAIWHGANPEGQFDGITPEIKAEVLAELEAEKK